MTMEGGDMPARNLTTRRLRLGGASAAALTIALVGAGGAWAQDNSAAKGSDQSGQVQEVIVTGSRIQRSTFTSPGSVK